MHLLVFITEKDEFPSAKVNLGRSLEMLREVSETHSKICCKMFPAKTHLCSVNSELDETDCLILQKMPNLFSEKIYLERGLSYLCSRMFSASCAVSKIVMYL